MLQGFNPAHVFRHPLLLITFAIALPAWIVAFAAQCAAEAKYDTTDNTPVVKYLWYSIWIQLACIGHFFLAASIDQLALHRFQLAIVLVIAEVFAVYGTEFIFSDLGALKAVGAAWLLLAIVDLLWILFLTSEEGTPFHTILNLGSHGSLSNRRAPRRDSAAAFANHSETGLGGGLTGGYADGMTGGIGYDPTPRTYASTSAAGYAPAATETTPQKATREAYHNTPPTEDLYKLKAKALFAYTASPTDNTEVSFAKGELLDVQDDNGKWYQVRTASGQVGIAPSNYLHML